MNITSTSAAGIFRNYRVITKPYFIVSLFVCIGSFADAQTIIGSISNHASGANWDNLSDSSDQNFELHTLGTLSGATSAVNGYANVDSVVVAKEGKIGAVTGGAVSTFVYEGQGTSYSANHAQYANAYSDVDVIYNDLLKIYDPFFAIGTPLSLTVRTVLHGDIDLGTDKNSRATGNATTYTSVGSSVSTFKAILSSSGSGYSLYTSSTILNGQPFFLGMHLTLFGSASSSTYFTEELGSTARYTLVFGNTLAWDGVSSLTDGAGNQISNYELTSASGIDYNFSYVSPSDLPPSAVPEPASTGVIASAVLMTLVYIKGIKRRSR